MGTILHVTTPPITSYTEIANLLSVLWVNPHRTMEWFGDHFIQLCAHKNKNDMFYSGNFTDNISQHDICLFQYCPLISCSKIDRELFMCSGKEIIHNIKALIDMKYYLSVIADQYYLSCCEQYMSEHKPHPVFIYGYNDESINISDFWKKYARTSIPSSEIADSLLKYNCANNLNWTNNFYLFKENNCTYEMNLDRVVQNLEDYLCSCNSFSIPNRYDPHWNSEYIYGISYYDILIDNLSSETVDIIPYHVNLDHKTLMLHRINHLISSRYLVSERLEDILNRFLQITEMAQSIRNLALLYKRRLDNHTRNRVIELCKYTRQTEFNATSELLHVIKHTQLGLLS